MPSKPRPLGVAFFHMGLEWQAPSKVLISRAVEMARRFDITVYDAVFTATAESQSADFITADKQMVEQLKDLPFVVYPGEIKKV